MLATLMALSAGATAKLFGASLCAVTAHSIYRTFPDEVIKRKLRKVFKLGEIVLTHKNGKNVKKRYPKIQRVKVTEDEQVAVFTLPTGLPPKAVTDKEWAFKQVFGESIEMVGDSKTFVLYLHRKKSEQFNYNFEDLKLVGKLPILLGKSSKGFECFDMIEQPHLLVSGETGSGKSVYLRAVLATLILSKVPVDLYCADLKRSEFHLFRGIAREVVVEPTELYNRLLWLNVQMRKRGDLLDAHGVSNIADLASPPPFIVLAIDEVALLKKEKACMEIIERVAAIGRALGVFLILSMQRPDAELLGGKLKQCLTARVSFRQFDELNSRIAIGEPGAELIKQKGLMIAKIEDKIEIQAPFLSIENAKVLLDPLRRIDAKTDVINETTEIEDEQNESILIEEDYLS